MPTQVEASDLSPVQQAEAEAVAAESLAAAARAHAQELRQRARACAEAPAEKSQAETTPRRRRPRAKAMIAVVAVVVSLALLAVSGYLVWHHQQVEHEQQRRAEFAAAASQAVVTLMSIDSSKAQADVDRIIENSTGKFRDDFRSAADEFVKAAQDAKATTKATVRASAVEAMTQDSAVVLVAAAATVSNAAGAEQQPRTWRVSVDMVRDGGQLKMSKVDFVP